MVEYRGGVSPAAGVSPTGDAANITVTDSGEYFSSSTVEGVFQELGSLETELIITVRNESGADIAALSPVHIHNFDADSGRPLVVLADASSGGDDDPCDGLTTTAIANNSEGSVVLNGILLNIDTSSWNVDDNLYLSTTAGTLSTSKPTGATDTVQLVARVIYSDASIGALYIVGTGRSNDIPNLTTNKYWEGNGSNNPAEVTADDILDNVTAGGAAGIIVGATLTTDKVWAGVGGVAAEVDVHDLTSHVLQVQLFPAGTTIATGDGAAVFSVPDYFASHDIVNISAVTGDAGGSSGVTTVQVHNLGLAADVLSTAVTIDNGEQGSHTAATPVVIDTANDHLTAGDYLRFDVDTVAGGTSPKGLWVTLEIK